MIKPLRNLLLAGVCVSFIVSGCNHNANKENTITTNSSSDTVAPNRPSPKPAMDTNAKDGLNQIYYSNGVLRAKGNYKAHKKEGEWQSFYQSGKLWSDEYYTGGLQDGQVVVYYENGQKMYDGQFKMGNQYGIWHYWNQKGDLTRTANYNKKSPNSAF